MIHIAVEGKLFNKKTKIEYVLKDGDKKGTLLLDGVEDEIITREIRQKIKTPPTIAGTYTPQKNTPMAVFAVLVGATFDVGTIPDVIMYEGLETIPNKKGVVY